MLEAVKAGLETTIQDFPGRLGSIPTLSPRQRSGSWPRLAQAIPSTFALLAWGRRRHCGGVSTISAARTSRTAAPIALGGAPKSVV
jgi:hypothetical protein